MYGLLGESGSIATPFLILKTSDIDSSRASLLSWEPSMAHDVDQIFGTNISARTSPAFADSVVAGFDARILNSQSSATVAYAFADKNTIVIAGSQSALADLLARIAKK
jgi:hypothetical protein